MSQRFILEQNQEPEFNPRAQLIWESVSRLKNALMFLTQSAVGVTKSGFTKYRHMGYILIQPSNFCFLILLKKIKIQHQMANHWKVSGVECGRVQGGWRNVQGTIYPIVINPQITCSIFSAIWSLDNPTTRQLCLIRWQMDGESIYPLRHTWGNSLLIL